MGVTGKIAMAVLGSLLAASVAFGQAAYTSPDTGIKPLGSYASWGGIDNVSLTNGNLMLNIPLFSLPGRELPVSLGVSFNSQFMERRTVPGEMGQLVTVWESQAWRKNTGIGGTLSGTSRSTTDGLFIEIYWIGPDGSKTRFSDTVAVASSTASHTYLDNRTIDATDSSFLRLETGHYFNDRLNPSVTRLPAILYFPNGTTLTFERDTDSATTQLRRWTLGTANGNTVSAVDSTGTMAGNDVNLYDVLPTTDTLGRTITFTTSGNTQTIQLPAAAGESRTYRINWGSEMYQGPYLESDPSLATASSVDMVQSIDLPNDQSYQFSYDTSGRLQTVTLPTGGRIVYTYYNPNNSAHWFVRTRTVYPDGPDTVASAEYWNFGYDPGRPVGTPIAERGPAPAKATVIDPTGAAMRHYFTDNLETKVETRTAVDPGTSTDRILQTVEQVWSAAPNPRVTSVKTTLPNGKVRKVDYTYDSFTDSSNKTVTYNNVTEEEYFDWGAGTAGTSLGTVSREFSTTATHLAKRLLRLVTSETRGGDRTTYVYDNNGNPTTITRYASATATLATTNTYDSHGNLTGTTDPGGHQTAISYDDRFSGGQNPSSSAYPTKVTDPTGYWVETTYDYNTGLPTKTVDSRSRTTSTIYDKMNRPTRITRPDGSYVEYAYNDTARTITKKVLVDAQGNVGKQITRLDKLGRVKQTETADPEGNIFVDTRYDKKGRISKVSNPYRSGETIVWNQTAYDDMDRPTTRTGPDGSTTTYAYADNQTTVTDQSGNARRYTYDGLGRMVKVEEPNPRLTTPQITSYAYNFHGDLKKTTQGTQVRTFAYDGLRRKTSQTLPESGTTTHAYNSDGLLSSMTDARSVTTTYAYDTGHRVTSRSYTVSTPTATTPRVSFTYDTRGNRTRMTDALGTVDYTYDTVDRLTREQRTLTGLTGTFTTGYGYDRKGNLTQMTYPSGRVVDYNYATGGGCCNSRLDSVMDKTTDTTLLSARTYQAFGGTLTQTLGNGATQSFSYNSRLQLTRITAAVGGNTVMDFTYGYGTSSQNTGRVRARTDAVQPEHSATYSYDSIYRLNQVQGADQSWGVSWTFDTWGNRRTQAPTGLATGKIGSQTLAYTNNRNTSFTYDAAGNQTNDGTHNYTFSAANQITQMDAGAAVYAYDGDGRRMKKTVGTETTYYFYAMGVLVSEFSTTNTGATAAASTDRTTYQTSDKLGTAVLIMAAADLVVENNRTLPYGEEWQPAVGSDNEQKFTSYQRDAESGLDYAIHRFDATARGVFMSVDPGPISLMLPQSLNRYIYAMADPVNYTDPSGLSRETPVPPPTLPIYWPSLELLSKVVFRRLIQAAA